MDFILFIGIVIVLAYTRSVASRLEMLERRMGVNVPPVIPAKQEAVPQATVLLEPIPQQPALKPEASPLQTDLSAISATQWVAGIGAIALLFGIGFFLRYAIEQGWLTETMRIALGAVVGVLVMILGELWKNKYTNYARVLTGGGLAILFFTVFASHQFYHKIDQPIAFLLMVLLAVLGVVLSYRYNSKALAALAVIGGYVAPILLHSGQNQQMALFAYLTLLNLGVLLMLLKEYWTELLFLALVGSGINFSLWAVEFSTKANTGQSVAFLVLNYLLVGFLTALLFRKLHDDKRIPEKTDEYLGIFYTIFGIAIFGTVTGLLSFHYDDYLAPVMLLLSVITFMSYVVIDRLGYNKINYPLSLIGAKFLVAAILWQFSGMTENVYLLAASMLGIAVGLGVRRKDLRTWGLILLTLSTIKIFLDDYQTKELFANSRFAVEVLSAVCFAVVTWAYQKFVAEAEERKVSNFTSIVAASVVWLAVSVEIATNWGTVDSENVRNLTLSIWWMVYAVILAILGGFNQLSELRRAAVVLFGLAVLKVFLYDVLALDLGYRIVPFILLGIILLSVSFAYQRNKERLQRFLEVKVDSEMSNS